MSGSKFPKLNRGLRVILVMVIVPTLAGCPSSPPGPTGPPAQNSAPPQGGAVTNEPDLNKNSGCGPGCSPTP